MPIENVPDRLRPSTSCRADLSDVVAAAVETSVVVGDYILYNDDDELAEVFNAESSSETQ